MSFDRFPITLRLLEEAVKEGVAPGFVAGVWDRREPEVQHLHAIGSRRLRLKGLSALPMEIDTIFDLASLTKVFGTATLAAMLVQRGWIRYSTPLSAILPTFRYRDVTLGHLLSHTAGLPAWSPFYESMKQRFGVDELPLRPVAERQAAMRELVLGVDPERGVEQRAVYSDVSFLLLGFALEEVLSLPLDRAVRRHVWEAMDLDRDGGTGPFFQRTTVAPFRQVDERVAATEDCPWRRTILQGQVHDDNCWTMGGYGGHAGAFGTARNLLRFSEVLQGGFLSGDIRRAMWSRVGAPADCERTLGWDTPSGDVPAFGRRFSRNSVGHLGFTGTSLWIDLDHGITVVLLSNRVHPSRSNEKLKSFRSVFHETLAGELGVGKTD